MDLPLEPNTIVSIIGLVIVAFTAIAGLIKYGDSVKLRRSEWLYKLYNQFYVEPNLKEIRQMIDSEKGKRMIEELIVRDETSLNEQELKQLNQFTDYCNFFEFIMYLKKSKVLNKNDVKDVFQYYLDLFPSDVIEKYLEKVGFELLHDYLEKDNKTIQSEQK